MDVPIVIPAPDESAWEFRVQPEDQHDAANFVEIQEQITPDEKGDTIDVHPDQAEAFAAAVVEAARRLRARKGAERGR